jgi:hypothetical protein
MTDMNKHIYEGCGMTRVEIMKRLKSIPDFRPEQVITRIRPNPYFKHRGRAAIYDLMKVGMTVGQYFNAYEDLGLTRKPTPQDDLRWDYAAGYIHIA